mmetsp:Transcript_35163/g.84861  ORF Transcript_35163/g.84861 Transcript_35163/m.84861 type:complete len:152 (-) Transcript_35163:167-622(-)
MVSGSGASAVTGPIFVSIGTPDKLETFLELNPSVPRESILVDDYDHRLYKQLGFGRFDEANLKMAGTDARKLFRIFDLGPGGMWSYATRFLEMAPLEGTSVDWSDLPEGGMRNGGTLVVSGEEVIYQWSDTIPSDVPNVADVVEIAMKATE